MHLLATTIPENRALTLEERTLIHWLLVHGEARATTFLSQLENARVCSRCSCGCASIDFAIDGASPAGSNDMDILSDYTWRDGAGHRFGAYVFAQNGVLAGLDLWSFEGDTLANYLPDISALMPIEKS